MDASQDTQFEDLPFAEGQSCWTGPEIAASGDWLVELEPGEVTALENAMQATAGREALDLRAADFPLGVFQDKLAGLRETVTNGRGFAMLRTGFSDLDENSARCLLWGLGQHLGVPQKQDGSGTLLHDVRDTGADLETQDDVRTYQTNLAQPFHNDGADMFVLLCRRQATNGGQSLMASAHEIFNEILRRRPDLARVLTEPFYFDARGQQLPGRPWYQVLPIYQHHGGRWFVVHKRHYIDLAQRSPDIPRLTEDQVAALDLMDELCHDPAMHLSFEMAPGDIVMGNNFSTLHSRTAFKDRSSNDERRHMLRLWLGIDGGVALPPNFAETREFGPLFETTWRA